MLRRVTPAARPEDLGAAEPEGERPARPTGGEGFVGGGVAAGVVGAAPALVPAVIGACLSCAGAGTAAVAGATAGAGLRAGGMALGAAVLVVVVAVRIFRVARRCPGGPARSRRIVTSVASLVASAALTFAVVQRLVVPLVSASAGRSTVEQLPSGEPAGSGALGSPSGRSGSRAPAAETTSFTDLASLLQASMAPRAATGLFDSEQRRSGGGNDLQSRPERTEGRESLDVDHRGGDVELKLGLAPAAEAGLAHAGALQVGDLALHLAPGPQQRLG
ncbi:MAG: hypothetical protein M3P85_03900, partial [Actinomycetota bacterium]|nr:hypothetical protein [Actinomycetota bacterium]